MAINNLVGKPYKGAFTVETWRNAPMDTVLSPARVSGKFIHVSDGTIQQVLGGIQFYAGDQPFSWGYKYIKKISDSNGNVLWENWDEKEYKK